MSAVVKFQPSVDDVPPHDITITMNLSGERQIIIRSPVTNSITRSESDARTDSLVHIAERQRALYELRHIKEEIENKRDALHLWLTRKSEAEQKHQASLDQLEKDITQAIAKREEETEKFIISERGKGKRGEISLQGSAKSRDEAMVRGIDALRGKNQTLAAEHLQNLQQIEGNIEKLTKEIEALERLKQKHQEIVG